MLLTPASLLYLLKEPEPNAAWERFVELYTPLLLKWARHLHLQESDCADLVQDVFLVLWKQLPQFEYDPQGSFHAWLKTVFLNRHRSRLRQRHPLALDLDLEGLGEASEELPHDPEETIYLIQQAYRLVEREFSPLHQQVFRLYVLEEKDPEFVGHQLGIRPGTVYGIKSKILSRLRQEFKPFFE